MKNAGRNSGGGKVVLVTGATSGFGLAAAGHLHSLGHVVYGAARRPEAAAGAPFAMIRLDVDDDGSTCGCVSRIIEERGRLDVLVNNAGFGIAGPVEDTSIEDARAQFETNYFGAVRMCRAALPHMRREGGGLIINMSSIGGLISVPFQSHYCASKFAVEGMSEGLRMEVRRFGIKVVLVEPGDFRTGFTAVRKTQCGAEGEGAYAGQFAAALARIEHDEKNGPGPEAVARLIGRIVAARSPKLRYVIAKPPQNLGPALKRLLPWGAIEKIVMSNYRIG